MGKKASFNCPYCGLMFTTEIFKEVHGSWWQRTGITQILTDFSDHIHVQHMDKIVWIDVPNEEPE